MQSCANDQTKTKGRATGPIQTPAKGKCVVYSLGTRTIDSVHG